MKNLAFLFILGWFVVVPTYHFDEKPPPVRRSPILTLDDLHEIVDHDGGNATVYNETYKVFRDASRSFTVKVLKLLYNANKSALIFSPLSMSHCLTALLSGLGLSDYDELFWALDYRYVPTLDLGLTNLPNTHSSLAKEDTLSHNFDKKYALERAYKSLLTSLRGSDNLTLALGIYVEESFEVLKEYINIVEHYYYGTVRKVDFLHNAEAARQSINGDALEATQGHIPNILPPGSVSALSKVVIANLITFAASWPVPFNPKNTQKMLFQRLDGSQIKIPMLYGVQRAQHLRLLFKHSFLQLCRIELWEPRFALYLVQPLVKFDAFMNDLMGQHLTLFANVLRVNREQDDVLIAIPKFETKSHIDMIPLAQKMGVHSIFSGHGDFSGITNKINDRLAVTTMLHKSAFQLNENGTQASAASSAVIGLTNNPNDRDLKPEQHVKLWFDMPFVYFLLDEINDSQLFMGLYNGPP